MNRIWAVILLCSLLGACGMSKEEITELATLEFQRKAALLRIEQRELCMKIAYTEAERQADSIIFQLGINPLRSPLYRPPVPPKPEFVPTDSTITKSKHSVKPILDPTKNNE